MKRRTLLTGAVGAALATTTTACAAPGAGTDDGTAALRMAWWGNQTRTDLTNQVIGAYQNATPGVSVTGESIEWASYWDRLATQTAADDAPDVIQMDLKYLREYGDRGALLDLDAAGLDTSGFAAGTLDSCRTDDGLLGVNAGVNALFIAANPEIFDSLGIDLPDDSSWTWDDLAALAAEIGGSGPDLFGMTDFTLYDLGVWPWIRQRGKDLYTPDGIGFDAADMTEWFTLSQQLESSRAIPDVGLAAEDINAPVADRLFVKGRTAMSVFWSNQVRSVEEASGRELTMLRFPSLAGDVAQAELFYNVSMMWCVPARVDDPDATLAFVDFLVNRPEAARILQAERGVPANTAMRDEIVGGLEPGDRKAVDYLDAIAPVLGAAPPAPPSQLGDISLPQTRYLQEVRFGRQSPADAAAAYVAELQAQLAR